MDTETGNKREYDVGYGKPPVKDRFGVRTTPVKKRGRAEVLKSDIDKIMKWEARGKSVEEFKAAFPEAPKRITNRFLVALVVARKMVLGESWAHDRYYGKPEQPVDLDASVKNNDNGDIGELSDDELDRMLKETRARNSASENNEKPAAGTGT